MTSSVKPSPTKLLVSPAKALQEIVQKQLSGRLTVSDPEFPAIYWRVYVGNGQIHFATSAIGQPQRLAYLLQRYSPSTELEVPARCPSDYQLLCNYWQANQLTLPEVRRLMLMLTQEALVQILALPQAVLQFERTVGLDPLLLSAPLKQVVAPLRKHINRWAQFRPEILSPFQRASIQSLEKFAQVLWQHEQPPQKIQVLSQTLSQNLCVYEAAYQLSMDAAQLAELLQQLVQADAVTMQSYCSTEHDSRPVIACVDDSRTVQRNVRLTLEACGYQVLELMEPARALTALARHKPALILMDISMPELDGYELCRLLRQSSLLRAVPIVMLTGRDGLIDRLRAKMVGATDYITKPFVPQQLLALVDRVISCAQVEIS